MKDEKIKAAWWLSLTAMAVSASVIAIDRILGSKLPPLALRLFGTIDLLALFAFVFLTVRITVKKRR